jgi:hypothetical protein
MSRLLFAGLFVEGTTDVQFLQPIIAKTLQKVAFECKGNIEIELRNIDVKKTGLSFVEQVKEASRKGIEEFGIMLLCVHTDSDSAKDTHIWKSKIEPAKDALQELDADEYCKIMVALVPIQMTEAWMLADINLLKEQIGTNQKDSELGLHKNPEEITNPKQLIQDIIRQPEAQKTKRRRRKELDISELYQIMGESIEIEHLEKLSAYKRFEEEVREALRILNFL